MINISVIIPTRNRAKLLEKTLGSLTNQTLAQEDYEVLVIDNNSADDTKVIVQSFFGKIRNIRYFHESEPGLHIGRNRGFKESKAEILVYADDDIEAFPSWLSAVIESFSDERVVLVGGKVLPKYDVQPPDWIERMWMPDNSGQRYLSYLSLIDLGDDVKEVSPHYIFGCNFSVRKSILLSCGGFHPDAMPQHLIRFRGDGESYISRYIEDRGYKVMYNPRASVHHVLTKDRVTLDYFKKRAFNEGISGSYVRIRYGAPPKTIFDNCIWLPRVCLRMIRSLYPWIFDNRFHRHIYFIGKSYRDGFRYHQREVLRDRELYRWVKKENY